MWTRPGLRSNVTSVNRPLVAYLIHDQNMSRDTAMTESKYPDKRQSRGARYNKAKLESNQAEIELRAGRTSNAAKRYLRQMIRVQEAL